MVDRPDLFASDNSDAKRDDNIAASTDVLGITVANQHRASNPLSSAWVSANAGSGKTFVLAQRVTRLLLNGVAPSKILCLTFTKAAAAEMSNRVFSQLSQWSAHDDNELGRELQKCGERNPSPTMLKTARLLFTRALESPGGLKIQTIHAFCEALLHQFTLEANTSGHFEVMSDYEHIDLLDKSRQSVMAATHDEPELARALATAMRFGSDQGIEKGLEEIIHDRQNFLNWVNYHEIDIDKAVADLGRFLDVEVSEPETKLAHRLLSQLPIDDGKLRQLGRSAAQLDFKECQRISNLVDEYESAATAQLKFTIRLKFYQTGTGAFRKKVPGVKALYDELPDIKDLFEEELQAIKIACDHHRNWKMLNGSLGLFTLADAVLQSYGHRKRARGILDYDDLVNRAADLLARSDVRQWVQYKLDQGIDHVLVDEAQDTSPVQWQIINAIVEEFFAGQSTSKTGRTVFAVGDQKQSIYSFQGAVPEMFAVQKEALGKKAFGAKLHFESVNLPISFRSTRDVLSAVDKVFSKPANARGLGSEDIGHEPVRQSDPGEVLIWPLIEHQKPDKQEDWLLPVDHISEDHPTLQLAKRIAATLKDWIDEGKILPGKGRKITYGDILILVRNRDRFASAITRELKQAGLIIAGADRLNLTAHIAVEDLLSLGKWALFPEDDLALAEVLKSPLFDFSEEELFAIAVDRGKNTLWQNLRIQSEEINSNRLTSAVATFSSLESIAATTLPFEFYSQILSADGGRKKFRSRLGSEVDDVLDAFMLEALNHMTSGGNGLQEFIHNLEIAAPDIKREIDLQKDEIRVMTVHSAKGLEAPIVFLVDPGSAAYSSRHRPSVMRIDCDTPYPAFLWQPSKDEGSECTDKIEARFQEKAEEEYRRLLYVGMTRAEDNLVLCGYANRNSGTKETWHSMVKDALIEDSEEIVTNGEISAWRWTMPHQLRKAHKFSPAEPEAKPDLNTLPDWVSKTKNIEPSIIPPLFPSAAALNIEARPAAPIFSAGESTPVISNFAIERGNATHHLLQFLPSVEATGRRQRADNYLQKSFPDWSPGQLDEVAGEVIAVLEDPRFETLFCEQSRAEVSLAGVLDPDGLKHSVSGQIDRIAILEKSVVIVDYKSDRFIPAKATEISSQYLVQLAIYRELVAQIFVGKPVRCALLWTSGPQLMEISDDLLSTHLEEWLGKMAGGGKATVM